MPQPAALAEGWEEVDADDGRVYWWNTDTDATTWTRPTATTSAASVAAGYTGAISACGANTSSSGTFSREALSSGSSGALSSEALSSAGASSDVLSLASRFAAGRLSPSSPPPGKLSSPAAAVSPGELERRISGGALNVDAMKKYAEAKAAARSPEKGSGRPKKVDLFK